MNKDSIKKILSGIGIAGLVASVGITMSACKKASSCGKGSCGSKDKASTEETKSGSCGKGSCGTGEKKTEEKK